MPFDDLEYADDVSFVHRTPSLRTLHDKVKQAKEHLGEWGLKVNGTKTQWLEVKGGGGHLSGRNVSIWGPALTQKLTSNADAIRQTLHSTSFVQ